MSATTVKLLRAASEIVAGDAALAELLGIGQTMLSVYMADGRELPDRLLLRAVDIILAERQSRSALAGCPAAQSAQEPINDA